MKVQKRYLILIVSIIVIIIVLEVSGLDSKNNIEELDFGYGNSVTQKDINEIGKMNSLKKLDFFIDSSDIDLSPLTNLNNLEELCITSGREGTGSLNTNPIGELKQIKKLH